MKTHEEKIQEQAKARIIDEMHRARTAEIRENIEKIREENIAAENATIGRLCACGKRHRTAEAYLRHVWYGYGK